MDLSTIKCAFAEEVLDSFLETHFGIEACSFNGYTSLETKYLTIQRLEYGNIHECDEDTSPTQVTTCGCQVNCDDYDPYKVCCKIKN